MKTIILAGWITLLIVLLNILTGFAETETSLTDEDAKYLKSDGLVHPYIWTGKEFSLTNNPVFPNLTVTSTEEIHINIQAVTDTLSIGIVPLTNTTVSQTTITITGLEPFWKDKPEPITLYRIEDGFLKEEFTPNADGKYTFVHQLDTDHHIYIRPVKNTIYIYGSPGQVIYLKDLGYGTTIYHQIVVGSDGIIIDGTGTQHIGYSPGTGIYLNGRSGVTVRNCTIYNWGYAIHSYGSWSCTYSNNRIGPNTHFGIRLDNASWYNIINDNNEISYNTVGINIEPNCSHNWIVNNYIHRNTEGIALGYECYYNHIVGNTIYWHAAGIMNGYRAGGNEVYENLITGNTYGVYLPALHTPIFYHNNIYGNALSYHAPDGVDRELSAFYQPRNRWEGNYWGHTSTPGFIAGVDSTGGWLHDTYPYLLYDGWKGPYGPNEQVDTTPPEGNILIISLTGNLNYTASTSVNIYPSITDPYPTYPPFKMRFSNDNITWPPTWDDYTTSKGWTLSAGDGIKTVWAQFMNRVGLISTVEIKDTIILDSLPPETSIISISPDPAMTNPTLRALATDSGSPITAVEFFIDSDPGQGNGTPMLSEDGAFDELSETVWRVIDISTLTSGAHTVYVRAKDSAGRWDTTPASRSFTVQLNTYPWINPSVPNITTSEDTPPPPLDLTSYGNDNEDAPDTLIWEISGVNTALYTATIDPATDILTINPVFNAYGTGTATLTLRDSGGLTASQDITITITPVNDKPVVTLVQPGKYPEVHSGTFDVIWKDLNDAEGDSLEINLYYNINDGASWFLFKTISPAVPPSGWYSWSTISLLDSNRYRVKIEAVETATTEKLSGSDESFYFTINNKDLVIKIDPAYYIDVGTFNPSAGEEISLIFDVSKPADNVAVKIYDESKNLVRQITVGSLGWGIHSVKWDGKNSSNNVVSSGAYYFNVEGYDTSTPPKLAVSNDSGFFGVELTMAIFKNLIDIPDPFTPVLPTDYTTISYGVAVTSVITRLDIYNESNLLMTTLVNNVFQGVGTYFANWTAAGIMDNGVFKYELSDQKPTTYRANNKYGLITVKQTGTVTSWLDTEFTVYSKPIGVTIEKPQSLPSNVTYALWNVNPPDSTTFTYPVSPFYNVSSPTPWLLDKPIIFAIQCPTDTPTFPMAPISWFKLFKYDTASNSFLAVGKSIIDPISHILYAEVDSLSLFVLMASSDVTKPQIKDFVLTPLVLNFTLTDELSGLNIPSIKVVLDNQDITDRLLVSGQTGDLAVTVSGSYLYTPAPGHTLTITAQDRGGNEVTKSIVFGGGYADTKLVLKPEALNINPGILTGYLKLPQLFGRAVRVEATLDGGALERWSIDLAGLPEEGLTGPVVVLKFRRQDIADALANKGEAVDTEFILKGGFDDGTVSAGYLYDFETSDAITKIVSEPQKQTADVSEPTAPPQTAPPTTEPLPPPDSGNNGNNKGGKKK